MRAAEPAAGSDNVLVVAPFGRDAAIVAAILGGAGFACEICANLPELAARLSGAGAAVMAEEALRPPLDRAALLAWIDAQPPWSDFPFIVLTARAEGGSSQSRDSPAGLLGNITLLERPLHAVTLSSAVAAALRARRRQRAAAGVLEDRERAVKALRDSEARYRTLAETLPQLVWTALPDGRCDYLSRQWVEYTGIAEADQLDFRWIDRVVHADDRERTTRHWAGAVDGRHDYDVEFRIRRRDGAYRWFKTRATPIRDDSGRIVHWFGTCTDIQDIVEARETLARGRVDLERLIESRTRERDRIFELSHDLFAIAGFDGYLKVINPAWERLLGFSRDELLSRPFREFIFSDDVDAALETIAELRRGRTTQRFEDRLVRADGSPVWVAWTAVPEGDVFYAVGRDVTSDKESHFALLAANRRLSAEMAERKRAEAALVQAQKMEAVGQLTGGIAHDFNNLLTVISGGLGMLEKNPDPERQKRLTDGMRQAVERGAALTGQLLAFSRRQTLRPEAVDVAARIRGMSELLERSLREDVAVVTDFPADLWPVEVDPGQLELVVLNLAVNARDAMPQGGRLEIRGENVPDLDDEAGAKGDFVRLCVSDTGTGMSPEVLAHAFEPFFTTKEVGQGTGLGLAQVYGFARQSGGAVRIGSEPGQGTTVTLLLPRSGRAPPQMTAPPRSDVPDSAATGSVLLVEDDENVAALTTEMVRQLGYEVIHVGNPEAALGTLADGRAIDVVFTDIVMPGGMSGVDLAREVRRRRPGLPVVLTTGYGGGAEPDAQEGMPILRKPYGLGELATTLREAVAAREPSPA